MSLDNYPLALMVVVLLIPVIYCAAWKKENLRKAAALWLLSLVIVLLYPAVMYASENGGNLGYFMAKLIIFVLLPIPVLMYLEKWTARSVMINVGVRRLNMERSIAYGLIAATITIAISLAISVYTNAGAGGLDAVWGSIMFLDAFTEEFLFRGVFFLYLMTLIDWRLAFITSVLAFVLVHPQYFIGTLSMFILVTITQAILLTWVAYKTKNIIGAWISHGLNRIVPQLVLAGLKV